jgi:DNA-binding transcriptional LysR family regulator
MELRHLRYFVAVAEELHFGRAAARLRISQPPLSQQIQALEAELAVQLFQRNPRNVTLTAAGVSFLAEARATLAQADHAVRVAKRANAGHIGELRVGFTPSVPFMELFPRLLQNYRAGFPDVEIKVVEMVTRHQIAAMVEQRLDVGFIRSPLPQLPDDIKMFHVFKDRLMLIARKEHRLASWPSVPVAELKGEPLIIMNHEANTGLKNQVYSLCAANGFAPTVSQLANGAWTPLALVTAGLGVSIVYSSLVERIKIEGVVKRPIDDRKAIGMVMFAHRAVQTPTAKAFTDMARIIGKAYSEST